MEQQPGAQPARFSDDGKWFWDGQQWRSAISEDGRWRWDGQQWQPYQDQAAPSPQAAPFVPSQQAQGTESAMGGQPSAADAAPPGTGAPYTPSYGSETIGEQSAQAAQEPSMQAGVSGSGQVSSAHVDFDHSLVTTAFQLDGMRVVKTMGIVRGIIVRSRSVVGSIGAGLQQVFGGNISIFTELCEQSRRDAYELMIQHASQLGANAVIGMRYDATELTQGVTEVLAYGTAVVVEPAS